ncbi:hypothetical protein IMSAGC007_02937 [Lachnospiraceae bacterium]|nr:hypothetical protein IMSAGC007_02937 [Lachnospiraceae bacterium]
MSLNRLQSFYFLINCIFSQSQKAEITAKNTLLFLERLNISSLNTNLKSLAHYEVEQAICKKPALHRFPKVMTKYVNQGLEIIKYEYNYAPEYIFVTDEGELDSYNNILKKLTDFPGIGIHKARVTWYKISVYLSVSNQFADKNKIGCPGLEYSLSKEFCHMKDWGI